jgi:hypothetical protein
MGPGDGRQRDRGVPVHQARHPAPARGGRRIVNISSIYGIVGGGEVPPYHASKGAVRAVSKHDAVRYAPTDSGELDPPCCLHHDAPQGLGRGRDAETVARVALDRKHPLGTGEPDDIAWARSTSPPTGQVGHRQRARHRRRLHGALSGSCSCDSVVVRGR